MLKLNFLETFSPCSLFLCTFVAASKMKLSALVVLALSSLVSLPSNAVPFNSQLGTPNTISLAKRSQEHPHVGRKKMVRGVNLGGWFILEAWMMPDFFDANLAALNVTDQYTLMTNTNATFAQTKLTNHWKTWMTETDFQQIAAAGLSEYWGFNFDIRVSLFKSESDFRH